MPIASKLTCSTCFPDTCSWSSYFHTYLRIVCTQHSCLPNLAISAYSRNLCPQTHSQMCFEWNYHPYPIASDSFLCNYLVACKSPLALAFPQLCRSVSHCNGIIISFFINSTLCHSRSHLLHFICIFVLKHILGCKNVLFFTYLIEIQI
jgi:hypothetical protein